MANQPPVITYLGHAGLRVEFGDATLVCDPWMSRHGAFFAGWHQFPPNDHLDERLCFETDYLYISHDHQDHCDEALLRRFPRKDIPVLIARFSDPTLRRTLHKSGFTQVIELDDWAPTRLTPAVSAFVVKDPSGYKTDSMLCLDGPGFRILNTNDCNVPRAYLRRLAETPPDLQFSQFSGAIWHPNCYQYDSPTQQRLSAQIRAQLLDKFVELCNGIGARHAVGFAGPPCFLQPNRFELNFGANGIFHDQWDVQPELESRLSATPHLALPGDVLRLEENNSLQITRQREFDFTRKREALEAYRERRQAEIHAYWCALPEPSHDLIPTFRQHLATQLTANPYLTSRVRALVEFRLGCHQEYDSVWADLRSGVLELPDAAEEQPHYRITVPRPLAQCVASGSARWEDLLASMYVDLWRDPDIYNWPLFALLRNGHCPEALSHIERMLQAAETDVEMVEVQDGDRKLRVQRYCPHAREDLSGCVPVSGLLICPRHHWVFDLNDAGRCVSGGNVALRVETPAASPPE